MKVKISTIILISLLLAGCSPEANMNKQIDKIISEVTYTQFSDHGFSIDFPAWPPSQNKTGDIEVSVTQGFCSVIINSEEIPGGSWYDAMIKSIQDMPESDILIALKDNLHVKHSMPYLDFLMYSDTHLYECNDVTYAVSVVCIDQADAKAQDIHKHVFVSAQCEEQEGKEVFTNDGILAKEADIIESISYKTYEDDDYVVEYPDWPILPEDNENRVFGVTKGICSVIVDKHNARPGDLARWIEVNIRGDATEEAFYGTPIEYSFPYTIDYMFPYEEHILDSQAKIFYCNYLSYITQVVCITDMMTPEYEQMREKVLNSAVCKKEYSIPTQERIEEQKKEVKQEEPEVIEEIEDQIVHTNAGEEFGIDEDMVVYFLNSNEFFTKIMKDFPKGNLIFEDNVRDRELELRVIIGGDGKITKLEDGGFDDADVTLRMPLKDALNIFNNAQNLNPMTLLSFAINVKTVPPEIKYNVIQNVLSGHYD